MFKTLKQILTIKKIRDICRTKPKMKSSSPFPELFQCTKKGVQEKRKIPAYGGKNKFGLMAEEKKPAYGRIKNYGQLLL